MMVMGEVAVQDAAQMPLAEDENVIQALASGRTDQALHEGILPGTVRRGENFLDSHAPHSVAELLTVNLVTVAQEIGRSGVVREGVQDLLSGPEGGGDAR